MQRSKRQLLCINFRQYQFIKMLQHLKSERLKHLHYVAPTELLGESLF